METLDKELDEWRQSLPDYPCTACRERYINCANYDTCFEWKTWFNKHWKRIRKSVGK